MRIHHLALLSPTPAALARWYVDTLGLRELRANPDEHGIRSVWLDLDGVILMVERGAPPPRVSDGAGPEPSPLLPSGWQGAFLAVAPGSGEDWATRLGARVSGRTAYTLYATDPEGNRFGLSSYPSPLFADP
jgi:catechol 2,3-dioxygenase-like lactoylglutathione lyase family enzyme